MVIDMKLTDKELEIMNVLWMNEVPMVASDIIGASKDRTWQDISIHSIMKSLLMKNAVVIDHIKPTIARSAKAYKATITFEDYIAQQILGNKIRKFNVPKLADILIRSDKNYETMFYKDANDGGDEN